MPLTFERFTVIAALPLLPFPGSRRPEACPVAQVRDHALANARLAVENGVRVLCLQDSGDTPVAPRVEPHTIAGVTAVGAALKREFPDLVLGISLMSHGAREPIAIAQAIDAQFVRLRVFVGAMVRPEGILVGCAHEAIQYRAHIGAEGVSLLADVYDRTGEPLGKQSLGEAARQAAVKGHADGLILGGRSFEESKLMLAEVRAAELHVPTLMGGEAAAADLWQLKSLCEGVLVNSAFEREGSGAQPNGKIEWDGARIHAFMDAAQR
jgi:membrane complex biogenesis BtpA family protein